MTNEDDVLPQSEKTRAIVVALATLRQAGIKATIDIEVGVASPLFDQPADYVRH
jgi:hypothetical protein